MSEIDLLARGLKRLVELGRLPEGSVSGPPSGSDSWLNTSQAAAYASCSVETLKSAVSNGEIVSGKVGKHHRFKRSALDAWIEGRPLGEDPASKAKRALAKAGVGA